MAMSHAHMTIEQAPDGTFAVIQSQICNGDDHPITVCRSECPTYEAAETRPLYSNGEILVGKKNLKSEKLMSKGIQFKGSERIETSNEES